jgi:3-hydroxybutyryl-CoA dehydratase
MSLNEELHGHYYEDIQVGQTAVLAKTITDADVVIFAGISMDTNPMHVNEAFAANTMFGSRIAHGMLGASLISAVFGTKFPGAGCIYVSQSLRFKAPVRIGDTMVARVTVTKVTEKKSNGFVEFDTVVTVGDTKVIEGEAMLLVPKKPA